MCLCLCVFVLMCVCAYVCGQRVEEYSFVSRINSILLSQAEGGGVSESGHKALFGLLPSSTFDRPTRLKYSRASRLKKHIFALCSLTEGSFSPGCCPLLRSASTFPWISISP